MNKDEWQKYFDDFSKKFLDDVQPEYTEVRILTDSMGVQPETQWVLLKGITYDSRGDTLDIQLDELSRLISHPKEIYVDETGDGWLLSFEVPDHFLLFFGKCRSRHNPDVRKMFMN